MATGDYAWLKKRAAEIAASRGCDAQVVMPAWGSLVNQAWAQFSWETEGIVAEESFVTVADQAEYTLAGSWKRLELVRMEARSLEWTSERAQGQWDPDWEIYPSDEPRDYIQVSDRVIRLQPAPSRSGVTVTVRGIRLGSALSAESDTIAAPAVCAEAVATWAAWLHMRAFASDAALSMLKREVMQRVRRYRGQLRNHRLSGEWHFR